MRSGDLPPFPPAASSTAILDNLALWRAAHRLHRRGHRRAGKALTLVHRVLTGATIPAECHIGEGTKVAYGGAGLVLNSHTWVGDRCILSPGVLLGSGGGRSMKPGAPTLEDGVRVYQNAVILGGVTIGAGAVVNANAVVLHDVPPGAIVNAPLGHIRG